MLIQRYLNLPDLLARKSFFLFGPRATGKSTLIAQQLPGEATVIDLLHTEVLLQAESDPVGILAKACAEGKRYVVIDEIQRAPILLNEVHRLIELHRIKFLLTGSSMIKLRRGGVNLLAGRAWLAHLHPLTTNEIDNFNLQRYLQYGGLPAVYTSDRPDEELKAYLNVYLQEEIRAEGVIRNLPPFARFLRAMGLACSETINFTKIGNDCQVPTSTVREYVRILEDSQLAILIEPWRKSRHRKAISTAKFYLFDTGIARVLSGIKTVEPQTDYYGKVFELFICMELRAYLNYSRKHYEINYWRTQKGTHEVDFVIDDSTAIEVKSRKRTNNRDAKNLQAIAKEASITKCYLVSCDQVNRQHDNIVFMFWQDFLGDLWQNNII